MADAAAGARLSSALLLHSSPLAPLQRATVTHRISPQRRSRLPTCGPSLHPPAPTCRPAYMSRGCRRAFYGIPIMDKRWGCHGFPCPALPLLCRHLLPLLSFPLGQLMGEGVKLPPTSGLLVSKKKNLEACWDITSQGPAGSRDVVSQQAHGLQLPLYRTKVSFCLFLTFGHVILVRVLMLNF